jgi:hypothetical protein
MNNEILSNSYLQATRCYCSEYRYRQSNYNQVCCNIATTIIKTIEDTDQNTISNIITPEIFNNYIQLIMKTVRTYRYSNNCFTQNIEIHKEVIIRLISLFGMPSQHTINIMINTNKLEIINFLKTLEYKITKDDLYKYLDNINISVGYYANEEHSNVLLKLLKTPDIEYDITFVHTLLSIKKIFTIDINKLKEILDIFNNIFNSDCLCLAIKNKCSYEIYKYLTNIIIPDYSIFKYVCFDCLSNLGSNKILEDILNYKIIPTEECFQIALSNYYDKSYIINLFIDYGYIFTYESFLKVTEKHIFINNIEKYDFTFDERFYSLCERVKFYPEYSMLKDCKINLLRNACRKREPLSKIKALVKSGIKPDMICLENACRHKNNTALVSYLINLGIVPTIDCLKVIIDITYNPFLNLVFNSYYNSVINDNIINIKSDTCSESETCSESDNSWDSETTISADSEIVKLNTNIISDISINDECNENLLHFENINTKIEIRTVYKINNKISKIFKLKNNYKYNFIYLKVEIMKYLIHNKLLNKLLVTVNEDLSLCFNIPENKYFHISDLDHLININYKI